MPIPVRKKDWRVCAGCFCKNTYCIKPQGCMMQELGVCLCIGSDAACLPVPDHIPKTCFLLPGLNIYGPEGFKVTCCAKTKDIYPDMQLSGHKKEGVPISGLCLGSLIATNTYCIKPFTLCADEGSTCLCVGVDCGFPCIDSVPNTVDLGSICPCFPLPGVIISPKCACCPKLVDLVGEDKFDSVGAPEITVTDGNLEVKAESGAVEMSEAIARE